MKRCEIFTDGSSRGNPGEAGCSYVIKVNGIEVYEGSEYLGIKTNNEAEYYGLLRALERALNLECESVTIYTDSELLANQIKGIYKVRAGNLKNLYVACLDLLRKFKSWEISHIERGKNKLADSLAKKGSKGGKYGEK